MNKKLIIVLSLVTVISLALAGYFYSQIVALKQDPQAIAQKEAKELVARVSKLMVLPEGEDPVVATVNDPEKVKDQPFFSRAQKGDKLLIYAKAQKAILYDPEGNIILDVSPTSFGTATANSANTNVNAPVNSNKNTNQPTK